MSLNYYALFNIKRVNVSFREFITPDFSFLSFTIIHWIIKTGLPPNIGFHYFLAVASSHLLLIRIREV